MGQLLEDKLTQFAMIAALFMYSSADAAQSADDVQMKSFPSAKQIQCVVHFEPQEAISTYLNNCFAALERKDIAFVSVVVRTRVIKKLSPALKRGEAKRDALKAEITRRLPGVLLKDSLEARADVADGATLTVLLTPSAQPEGSVRILASRLPSDVRLGLNTPESVQENTASFEPRFGFGLLAGQAAFKEASYRFLAVQALAHRPVHSSIRAEGGLQAGLLADDAHKDLYQASGFAGAGVMAGPMVMSLRGTLGGVSTQEGLSSPDWGAQGALVYEKNSWSIGGVFHVSRLLRTSGLHLGVRL